MKIGTVLLDHLIGNVMIVLFKKIEGLLINKEILKLHKKSILGHRVEIIKPKRIEFDRGDDKQITTLFALRRLG